MKDAAEGLLSGAVDIDSPVGSLQVVAYTQPARGSLIVRPDGGFTYETAEVNAAGVLDFEFTVSDGTANSTGSAKITVTGE